MLANQFAIAFKMVSARVKSLFIKQERKAAMSVVDRLDLRQGFGIEGDVSSDEMSPRQILVVSSLDLKQFSTPPGELRENIVLDLADEEAFKPGAKLSFTNGAAIRLTFYCEPCKHVAHLVDTIAILEKKRGILGVVSAGGAISLQDSVKIEPNYYPALSEIPYERFLNYVAQIPKGKVVTYKQVLKCIGVDRSYFRVIPTYLKKASNSYPAHRVLDSQGKITSHIFRQQERLEAEGIEVSIENKNHYVDLEKYILEQSVIY